MYRCIIVLLSFYLFGCAPRKPSKEEIESAKTAALIMGTTCLRSNVEQRTGGWDDNSEKAYRDSLSKIDKVLARMAENGWGFCREELVEMRAITSRGRAITKSDAERACHLVEVVNARARLP